jgi:predicted short-subunit dehydrogenase-like oxidoreductase (DUF2520 family)
MTSIVFLGFGNVGYHLCKALHKATSISVVQIYNRNQINLPSELDHIPFTTQISELKQADVYIIAVTDDAISSFSESLSFKGRFVVHTSGSVALNSLSGSNRRGVLYPLQSFSRKINISFRNIPICIEAENKDDLALLRILGESISEKVVDVGSEDRAKLHLAAVVVNNFVNHLYAIGEEITAENGLPFELLLPLISETAKKIEKMSPREAQTGPAIRKDHKTIEKHLHLLANSEFKTLYEQLTKSIQNKEKTHKSE